MEKEVRAVLAAAAQQSTAFPRKRLAELGWDELLADEPRVAVSALFEEMGRLLLTGPALDAVVLAALGNPWPWKTTRVLYPMPGAVTVAEDAGRLTGLTFDGLTADIELVVVPVSTPSGTEVRTLPATTCHAQPVTGLDESANLHRVQGYASSATPAGHQVRWDTALIAARRAMAHELVGISAELLRIAVEHVSVREQFGRPLGANQAVQHRLADARVELAAAQELTAEAWRTESDLAAAAAKGMASRAFETVAANGQQVLGGIGYTWEHHWRHPLRRGMAFSAFLGAVDECEHEVALALIGSGVPRIGDIAGFRR
jgi:hypothetical protein